MGHKYVKEEDTFSTSANGTVPKPTAAEVSDGKYLKADGSWATPSGGGGGGSSTLAGLDDVALSNPSNGQVLKYNSTSAKWENDNESGGSGHTYSTTEQVVGKWTDNSDVYEKVYTDTFGNNATSLVIGFASGTFKVISISGFIIPSDVPTNTVSLDTKSSLIWIESVNSSSCEIRRGNGAYFGSTPEAQIIVRYTKSS